MVAVIILFQANLIFADEDSSIISIDFVTGNIIDLDESPQMLRADIQIQNYNPQDGYHFMEVTRLNDGQIIKDTEILPRVIDDDLYGVKILHYVEPDTDEKNLIGDYKLRIYSEYGSSETISTFSIIKSSMPVDVTQNTVEELTLQDESVLSEEESNAAQDETELQVTNLVESESKIPSWVHEIFVWYAEKTISENDLLTALEFLISQGILDVNSN